MTTPTPTQYDCIASIQTCTLDAAGQHVRDEGITLTHDERDEIGDAGAAWLTQRLGLTASSDADGVTYSPARSVDGDEDGDEDGAVPTRHPGAAMTTQTATLITFAIARDDGKTRTLRGWTLPDGRVITYGTGVDGRDSLWASAAAVEACGLDRVESYEIGDDTTLIPLLVLVGADKDNVEYGGASLLTAAELAD